MSTKSDSLVRMKSEIESRAAVCFQKTDEIVAMCRRTISEAYDREAKDGHIINPDGQDLSGSCDLMKFRVSTDHAQYHPCAREKCKFFEVLDNGLSSCNPRRRAIMRFLETHPELPMDKENPQRIPAQKPEEMRV